jgi:hypothetical protein
MFSPLNHRVAPATTTDSHGDLAAHYQFSIHLCVGGYGTAGAERRGREWRLLIAAGAFGVLGPGK